MIDYLDPVTWPACAAHATGTFVAAARGADPDEALDAARIAARGASLPAVSVADADFADLVALDGPACPMPAAVLHAADSLALLAPGSLVAHPVCAPRGVPRRRVSLVVADTSLQLPDPGELAYLEPGLRDTLSVLADASAHEELVAATLRSDRVRHKVATTRTPAPNQSTWVARDAATGELIARCDKMGEAAREARAALANGPARDVEVTRETRRTEGAQVLVSRYPAARRASWSLTFMGPAPQGARIVGWVFAGRP